MAKVLFIGIAVDLDSQLAHFCDIKAASMRPPTSVVSQILSDLLSTGGFLFGGYWNARISGPMCRPVLELVVDQPFLQQIDRQVSRLLEKSKLRQIQALQHHDGCRREIPLLGDFLNLIQISECRDVVASVGCGDLRIDGTQDGRVVHEDLVT